jgi:hypothetical protein
VGTPNRNAVDAIKEQLRNRVRRWFAGRGLIDHHDVVEMPARENSGCSLAAAVRVGAHDRADISGLLSYWLAPLCLV